jgi:predicted nucleotidyltransferase
MNYEILSQTRNKLKYLLNDKGILDVILFGSLVKGKLKPNDIDVALITNKRIEEEIVGFHISTIAPKDFFINPPSIISTIIKEGYSIKNKKYFSEYFRFNARVLFTYNLKKLNASKKVKIVNLLRGNKKEAGLVIGNKGEWLANQVFLLPIESSYIIEKFLINQEVEYKRMNLLID